MFVAEIVVADRLLLDRFLGVGQIEHFPIRRQRQHGDFQPAQRPPGVAVGHLRQKIQRRRRRGHVRVCRARDCLSLSARSSNALISSFLNGCNSKIWLRLSSGEIRAKNGFAVVAAIKATMPSSTSGSRICCCDLLK